MMRLWYVPVMRLFSDRDATSLSFIRIGAALFGATAIGLSILSTIQGNPFDAAGFLGGAAALLAGGGVGARVSEPGRKAMDAKKALYDDEGNLK